MRSSGSRLATIRRPTASQPLSTDDSHGVAGSPPGEVGEIEPSRMSYQLKYWPAFPRSMCSSVVIVRFSRATASRWPMIPSRSAATALHRPAPMLVGEVGVLRTPCLSTKSAGSPVCSSVIATIDAHVPRA